MRRGLSSWLVAAGLGACGYPTPRAPVQPIPFSHQLHAGKYEIGCTLCHAYARRGPVAGIPTTARCNACHKFVATDKPEVKKVNAAFAAGRPLVWDRVWRLPDHVYFTHERHVAAGLACQKCHGPVETMEVTARTHPVTMGWCVDCHRERAAPTDCLTCHK